MIKVLKMLMDQQKELDTYIFKNRGIESYDENIEKNIKIALFVELGELMNEVPTNFKHWRKNCEDDREKAIEEYVDCLHFSLSLAYHYQVPISFVYHDYDNVGKLADIYEIDQLLVYIVINSNNTRGLHALFLLGNKLGFTWDEIYCAYNNKNRINYERQKTNY